MKLGVSFGHGLSPFEVLAGAMEAEATGLYLAWVSESTGFDSLSILGAIAAQTSKLRLGSGIVNIYSRTPTQLAMAASTIQQLSGGRFILGLGASTRSVVAEWHGVKYSGQLSKVREAVEEIKRKLVSSVSSEHDGERPRPPIVVSAVQDKMTLLAREVADGVLFFLRPASNLKRDSKSLASSDFAVHASVVSCVSSDSERAAKRVNRTVAFYLAYGDSYRRFLLANTSLDADVASKVKDLWLGGKREDASRLVPRDLIDEVSIYGTPQECVRKIEQSYSSIENLSTLALQFNPGEVSISESFGRLSETFRAFETSHDRI